MESYLIFILLIAFVFILLFLVKRKIYKEVKRKIYKEVKRKIYKDLYVKIDTIKTEVESLVRPVYTDYQGLNERERREKRDELKKGTIKDLKEFSNYLLQSKNYEEELQKDLVDLIKRLIKFIQEYIKDSKKIDYSQYDIKNSVWENLKKEIEDIQIRVNQKRF